MSEELSSEDKDLLNKALAVFNNARGVLDFTSGFLAEKYKLGPNDKIDQSGNIARESI